MKNKTVLITAGPTREFIDPVRFISNLSSGKLGYKIAEKFLSFGFKVILISGPVSLKPPKGLEVYNVVSASEMFAKVKKIFPKSDIFISTAAVCDYKPVKISKQKIKKSKENFILKLTPTIDILKYCGKNKRKGQILVGFSLETDRKNALKYAFKKLKEKNLDFVVVNFKETFDSDYIKPTIIFSSGEVVKYKKLSKENFALELVNMIKNYGKEN
jgi:phosphopantothenoylcysteine synthetase/decarboxylase